MNRAAILGIVVVVGVAVATVAWKVSHRGYLPTPAGTEGVAEQQPSAKVVDRGEYLARAGDCVACHSEPTGKPFAGGRAMATPFGNLYVTSFGNGTVHEFSSTGADLGVYASGFTNVTSILIVPEPSCAALIAAACSGLLLRRRRG